MVRMSKLPDGYRACLWCGHPIRLSMLTDANNRCPKCDMLPHADDSAPQQVAKSSSKRTRTQRARTESWNLTPVGRPVIGVDPGARYTGVVVRDGDAVLYAATLTRDPVVTATDWALQVVAAVQVVSAECSITRIAVEGVNDPKGFKNGKKDPINPAWIMRAAVVLGAVVATWPNAVVVKPGGNGSKHPSAYPPALVGRRPKDLPGDSGGAGTRGHEQSAYDAAGKAAGHWWPAAANGWTVDNAVAASEPWPQRTVPQ